MYMAIRMLLVAMFGYNPQTMVDIILLLWLFTKKMFKTVVFIILRAI